MKEIENQLILARDLKYISNTEFSDFAELITQSSKLLSGLQKSTIDKAP